MKKWLDGFEQVVDWLEIAITILIVGVIGLQIITRSIFNLPLNFPEEVACFSLIVMVFVGLPIVERYDSHLRVEFLEERLGPGAKKVFRIISRILILGCVAGVLAGEAQLFPQIKVLKTHAAGIPYAWLHTVMIVFSVLWGIFALLGLIRDIRKKV